MIRRAALAGVALAAVLATVGASWAQGPQPGRPRLRAAQDEFFKMVDAYIVSNLEESLGLTDEQFVKLLPLVKRLQSDRRTFARRRIETLGEIRRLLQSGSATEGRIGELMKELRSIEVEKPATLRKDLEAIDAALTPLQQAKLRILEAEVEQKIREIMLRVRRQNRPVPPPRGEPPEEQP